jgi:ABC-2 type transport system permease protein
VSDQFKAAWVYYATPTATPGRIMSGAFKAIWIKFFLPFWVIISVFVLYIWGAPSLIDILLAVCNMTLFAACMMRVAYRILPFSTKEQMNNAGNRFLRVIMMLAVPGLLGFGHYLAVDMAWLKCIFLMLSAILLWLVWDSYANTSWDNVRKADI